MKLFCEAVKFLVQLPSEALSVVLPVLSHIFDVIKSQFSIAVQCPGKETFFCPNWQHWWFYWLILNEVLFFFKKDHHWPSEFTIFELCIHMHTYIVLGKHDSKLLYLKKYCSQFWQSLCSSKWCHYCSVIWIVNEELDFLLNFAFFSGSRANQASLSGLYWAPSTQEGMAPPAVHVKAHIVNCKIQIP